LKIKQTPIDELIPYASNSRTHSDEQVAQIAASIKEFGFNNPVLLDKENGIIAGHGRVLAARKLGLKEVPTIELSHLTDTQRKAYVIADNKLALNAGWDMELLSLEMGDLRDEGFDLSLIGFNDDELANIFVDKTEGLTDPDEVPDIPDDPVTKEGDVWLLGKHRLMCGSSTDISATEKLFNGVTPDMVFADPPYGIDVVQSNQVGGGGPTKFEMIGGGAVNKGQKIVASNTYAKIEGDETTETAKDFYNTCVALELKNIVLWGGNYFTDFLAPSRCWVVWDKEMTGNFSEAEMAWTSFSKGGIKVFKFLWNGLSREGNRKDELKGRVHPTQKPVGLFCNIFERFDGFKIIYDGFGGSGSTLIACEKTGRNCLMMELAPEYCDVIIKRWQDFTGEQAKLEGSGQIFPTIKADAA
jgi:DNA modification methylase|tara:strand:- start:224 stop:1465 length:1242 start_codon:yes stop_codon:yes gene_type:complete